MTIDSIVSKYLMVEFAEEALTPDLNKLKALISAKKKDEAYELLFSMVTELIDHARDLRNTKELASFFQILEDVAHVVKSFDASLSDLLSAAINREFINKEIIFKLEKAKTHIREVGL